jgi:hypothetical protein
MPDMSKLKNIILIAIVASALSGCSALNPDKGNTNVNTVNANKPKESTTETTPIPTPTPTAAPAVAQNVTERVKFGKGKDAATLKGEVTANGSSTYTLGAKAGQLMNIEVTSGKKGVSFDLVDKSTGDTLAENVSSWGESLPSTGDYVIRVYSTKGGDSYTLKVSIEDEGE